MKFCTLVYTNKKLQFVAFFNLDKIYALFGVNYFSPEIMHILNLGYLEGLHINWTGYPFWYGTLHKLEKSSLLPTTNHTLLQL